MHPGPINRGVEIDSELADGDRSVILEQVTNGIAVRMAVLYLCAGGQPETRRRDELSVNADEISDRSLRPNCLPSSCLVSG